MLKDGKPYLALSTPGGDNQDQALLQVFLNILEFGMTPQEAVEAPRFQTEHFYSSFAFHEFVPGKLNVEGRVPKATTDKLTALGHKVTVARRLEQCVGAHGDSVRRRCAERRGRSAAQPVHFRPIIAG